MLFARHIVWMQDAILECSLEMHNGQDGYYRMKNNYYDCVVLQKSAEVLARASRSGKMSSEAFVDSSNNNNNM